MAGPATAHWETSHWSASTPSLLKHHGKTTVFIRLVVEVGVIGLCTALYGSLKQGNRTFRPAQSVNLIYKKIAQQYYYLCIIYYYMV